MGASKVALDEVVDDPVIQFVVFCPAVDRHSEAAELFFNNFQSLFTIHFDKLHVQRIAGCVPVDSALVFFVPMSGYLFGVTPEGKMVMFQEDRHRFRRFAQVPRSCGQNAGR